MKSARKLHNHESFAIRGSIILTLLLAVTLWGTHTALSLNPSVPEGPFRVIAVDPTPHALQAPPNNPILATFDLAVKPASVNAGNFVVRGAWSGRRDGAFAFPLADQIRFDPAGASFPGEIISVVATGHLQSQSEEYLTPYGWQFESAVAGGSGEFENLYVNLHGVYDPVAVGDLDGDGDLDAVTPSTVLLNPGTGFLTATTAFDEQQGSAIAVGDVDNDGDLDIYVGNSFVEGAAVGDVLWVNNGNAAFTKSSGAIPAGTSEAVVLGDVDNDGDLDALLVDSGDAQILLNSAGVFTSGSAFPPFSVDPGATLSDVDNDGDLDAISTERVWWNDGYGTFTYSEQTFPFGIDANALAVGDLNGDGNVDLFLNIYGPNVVLFNDGSGTFADSGQRLGSDTNSRNAALGDVDGDGDLDAIGGSTLWRNDGSGIFDDGREILEGTIYDMTLGDLDNDGDLDAYVSSSNGHSIWRNVSETSPPALYVETVTPVPHTPDAPVTTTLRAATNLQLSPTTVDMGTYVVHGALSGARMGSIAAQEDTAIFTPTVPFMAGEPVAASLTGDVESLDGKSLSPYAWQFQTATAGTGHFFARGIDYRTDESYGAEVGDLDGDGDVDLLVYKANEDDPYMREQRIWKNNGDGTFTMSNAAVQEDGFRLDAAAALGDFDNDGDLDLVSSGSRPQVYLNNGNAIFSATGPVTPTLSWGYQAADLDGDGALDLYGTSSDFSQVYLNDGNGTFTLTQSIPKSREQAAALGDLDGDGDIDAFQTGQPHQILLNDGDGLFLDSGQLLPDNVGNRVALADLDGDGDLDAIVTDRWTRRWLLVNNGHAGFSDSGRDLTPDYYGPIVFADVDGDGDLDVIAAKARRYGQARLWLNVGGEQGGAEGDLIPAQNLPGDEWDAVPYDLEVADLDGNGTVDILSTAFSARGGNLIFNHSHRLFVPIIGR